METETQCKQIHHHEGGTFIGGFWFAGWLFTIAFAQLVWWKALLGLVIWPYYLGLILR